MARIVSPSAWPPRTLARIPLGYLPRDSARILELTEEQTEVARRLGTARRALLDGVTGSGKTHIAAAVAAAYARVGEKVLFLAPRKPLATWLQRALHPLGIVVMTIGECAREVFHAAGRRAPTRRGYEDPEYFLSAAALAKPDRWDTVIGDEWQSTTPDEQQFAHAVAGSGKFIEVRDSSRELRGGRIESLEPEVRLELHRCMRSTEPLARLDLAYAQEGLEPLPPRGPDTGVFVTQVEHGRDEPQRALLTLLDAFRARGVAPGEVGVVSALGRAQSSLMAALNGGPPPRRALSLSEPWSLNQLACDSFAYWFGLERRVMVVVEAPMALIDRRRRLHIAVSRACEEVHFLLPRADVDSDAVLSAWIAGGDDRSRKNPK